MFARQLCRHIPGCPGLRPRALRPTLSGGLPLSGYESLVPTLEECKVTAINNGLQVIENNGQC